MLNINAFARARMMFSLIAAAAGLTSLTERMAALNGIPAYKSRGKGGKRAHRPTGVLRVQRAALKARNVKRNRKAHR